MMVPGTIIGLEASLLAAAYAGVIQLFLPASLLLLALSIYVALAALALLLTGSLPAAPLTVATAIVAALVVAAAHRALQWARTRGGARKRWVTLDHPLLASADVPEKIGALRAAALAGAPVPPTVVLLPHGTSGKNIFSRRLWRRLKSEVGYGRWMIRSAFVTDSADADAGRFRSLSCDSDDYLDVSRAMDEVLDSGPNIQKRWVIVQPFLGGMRVVAANRDPSSSRDDVWTFVRDGAETGVWDRLTSRPVAGWWPPAKVLEIVGAMLSPRTPVEIELIVRMRGNVPDAVSVVQLRRARNVPDVEVLVRDAPMYLPALPGLAADEQRALLTDEGLRAGLDPDTFVEVNGAVYARLANLDSWVDQRTGAGGWWTAIGSARLGRLQREATAILRDSALATTRENRELIRGLAALQLRWVLPLAGFGGMTVDIDTCAASLARSIAHDAGWPVGEWPPGTRSRRTRIPLTPGWLAWRREMGRAALRIIIDRLRQPEPETAHAEPRPWRLVGRNRDWKDGSIIGVRGICASSGVARGTLCRTVERVRALGPSPAILVVSASDDETIELPANVVGVVAELPNPLSHLAFRVRARSVPMIVGLPLEAERWRDGDEIVVDANGLEVRRIE